MFTDSIFSALGPYLWLGDVFVQNITLVRLYDGCTVLFYIANTFFVCLLLYVIHYFGLPENTVQDDLLDDRQSRQTSFNTNGSDIRKARQSPYLALDDIDTDHILRYGSEASSVGM